MAPSSLRTESIGGTKKMQDLISFPCAFLRGGTSRGLFFHRRNLPDPSAWDGIFMAAMGTPDVRQINGLGGATSHTSKIAVISTSQESGADVDYLFAQVGISEPVVDYKGMCGNLLAAVGPFAVDEGLVKAVEPITPVRVFNFNTRKHFVVNVPVRDGRSVSQGDYRIDGVAGSGAYIRVDYLKPGGAYSGKLFPTGRLVDLVELEGIPPLEVTILDVANPMVFIRAEDLGIRSLGMEDPRSADPARLLLLERIRSKACYLAGFIDTPQRATQQMPAVPRPALVQGPTEARTLQGRILHPSEMDLYSHMSSMQRMHQSYAGTGAVCLAVAACIPGTVVHSVLKNSGSTSRLSGFSAVEPDIQSKLKIISSSIRFGHPSGIFQVEVEEEGDLKQVSMGRTARRLMDGRVFVPASVLK
jgi:2-methylaconitate cis-trans-isomerase PrpF